MKMQPRTTIKVLTAFAIIAIATPAFALTVFADSLRGIGDTLANHKGAKKVGEIHTQANCDKDDPTFQSAVVEKHVIAQNAEVEICDDQGCTGGVDEFAHLREEVALHKLPAGASHHFRSCGKSTSNTKESLACRAVGSVRCNNKYVGNASIAKSKGSIPVIVTNAHVLVDKDSGGLKSGCKFFPMGKGEGISIGKPFLGNTDPWNSREGDIAAAPLLGSLPSGSGNVTLWSFEYDQLPRFLANKDIEFSFLSYHPAHKKVLASGFTCSPVEKQSDHQDFGNRDEFNHNCPLNGGLSGSPGMMYDNSSRGYAAFCIHSGEFGYDQDDMPFDPKTNPNTCARVTSELIHAVQEISEGEIVVSSLNK